MDTQSDSSLDKKTRPQRISSGRNEESETPELQSSLHPLKKPEEPLDAGAPRSVLRPVETPPPSRYAARGGNEIQALEEFAGRLAEIVEQEYGDWMRRANLYFLELATALSRAPDEIRARLFELHMLIQYCPNFKILETSREAIRIAMEMRKGLGAQSDLGPPDFGLSMASLTEGVQVPPYSLRLDEPVPPEIENWIDGPGNDLSINGELKGFTTR